MSPLRKLALIAVPVLVVELINSAVGAVVNLIPFDPHPLSKNAKDRGGAPVFLAPFVAAVTWAVIVLPLI